ARSRRRGRRYSKTAWTRRSFEPKWYCTAELLPFPAAAPICRNDTPSMPRSAKSRSATRTICSLVEGAITDMGGSQHAGQRESTVLEFRRSCCHRAHEERGNEPVIDSNSSATCPVVDFD